MDHDEEIGFGAFLADRMRDKSVSMKKLSDLTGIALAHIEALLRDDFESAPSAPYLRGYLIRIGKLLDFDGGAWWMRLKRNGSVKNSGDLDTLPENRFIRQSAPKYLWAIAAALVLLIYLALQAPRIFGKPTLTVTFPDRNPYSTSSSVIMIAGAVSNADTLSLNNDTVIIAKDCSWEKGVLLQGGQNPVNTLKIAAKKFLGGETDIVLQIIYDASTSTQSSQSRGGGTTPVVHFGTSTATGTPFN